MCVFWTESLHALSASLSILLVAHFPWHCQLSSRKNPRLSYTAIYTLGCRVWVCFSTVFFCSFLGGWGEWGDCLQFKSHSTFAVQLCMRIWRIGFFFFLPVYVVRLCSYSSYSYSPDVTPCGWLGSMHQLTNSYNQHFFGKCAVIIPTCLFVPFFFISPVRVQIFLVAGNEVSSFGIVTSDLLLRLNSFSHTFNQRLQQSRCHSDPEGPTYLHLYLCGFLRALHVL